MNNFFGKAALTILLFASSTAYADSNTDIKRLSELLVEKGVITRGELETKSNKNTVTLGGYIQIQGLAMDESHEYGYDSASLRYENGFQVRRAKIAASGTPYENLNYRLEVNFARSPKLDDAYMEYDRLPYFVPRAGQFKVPFSLEISTPDSEILSIERSEVVNQIAPDRDAGIMLSGKLAGETLSYYAGVFNGHRAEDPHAYKIGAYGDSAQNESNDNDLFMIAGRVLVKPADWIGIGVNALSSKDGHDDPTAISVRWPVSRIAYGVDLRMKNRGSGTTFQGEYLRQEADGIITRDVTTTSDGFYLMIGQFFIPERLEGMIKYEEYRSDVDVVDRDHISWTTVGLNFFLDGHDAKLMANYAIKDEKKDSFPNNAFLAQLQLRF